jgi:HAD superfamily hydrolase (TIGR01484 family)
VAAGGDAELAARPAWPPPRGFLHGNESTCSFAKGAFLLSASSVRRQAAADEAHMSSGGVRPAASGHRCHLVLDLDGTLLPADGDREGLQGLQEFLRVHPGIVVSYATGRTLSSTLQALELHEVDPPAYLVSDVGTAIHVLHDGAWVEEESYARLVESRWQARRAEAWAERALPAGVRRQASIRPARRVPLELSPGAGRLQLAAELVRLSLAREGLVVDVLASGDTSIDVLPRDVDKGRAIEFLCESRHLPRPLVVCGDSENDVAMLRRADVPVLMSTSRLTPEVLGLPAGRVVTTPSSGPRGILTVLRHLLDASRAGA